MKEKLEELKMMDSEKIEDLFYELHKNQCFDDESDAPISFMRSAETPRHND